MHTGHKAGTVLANRPASINPWFLYKSGWANLIYIDEDTLDVDLVYNTSDTMFSTYYVRQMPGTDERFLVENRQYDNTYDQSLPGAVEGLSGGVLIWNIVNDGLALGETDLVEADNDAQEEMANMAQDVFRPDVYTSGMISDITSPANLTSEMAPSVSSRLPITSIPETQSTWIYWCQRIPGPHFEVWAFFTDLYLRPTNLPHQPQAQFRHVGDQDQRRNQDR